MAAYRILWWTLLASAVAAAGYLLFEPETPRLILALRLAKSAILIAVAAILFRRRARDPVAALFGLSFLLWTISSSVDFIDNAEAAWPALVDRLRFLIFALALVLFPDGQWQYRRTGPMAAAIFIVFGVGSAEGLGLLATRIYLPLAIACVLLALASLLARYRSQSLVVQQQLKWITLGLLLGIALILSARAGATMVSPSSTPMAVYALLEFLFQLGIVVIALGFLTSLLRYRLYDAEAAISRSAAYAGLTLALVGTFAASESIIQTLGQRYFGPNIGDLSGGIAAAVAAVLLTPLHAKISGWAEQHFQRDLTGLKTELPDLLDALAAGSSAARLASAVLPRIEDAIHSARIALVVDGKLVGARGITKTEAGRWAAQWAAPNQGELFDRDSDPIFAIRMALHCPSGKIRGWLLLGARPDGSLQGQDDLDALAAIAPPLRKALFMVVEREREERRRIARSQELRRTLERVCARLSALEKLN